MDLKMKKPGNDIASLFANLEGKPALEMNDGTVEKLDLKLNIKKLLMINKDFNTDEFIKANMNDSGMDYTILQGLQAVYIAYRQAHMNKYLDFEEFTDAWDFDNATAQAVYFALLFKDARNEMFKSFQSAFKAKK